MSSAAAGRGSAATPSTSAPTCRPCSLRWGSWRDGQLPEFQVRHSTVRVEDHPEISDPEDRLIGDIALIVTAIGVFGVVLGLTELPGTTPAIRSKIRGAILEDLGPAHIESY